ncbi:hypothetical protein ACFO4P_17065 [Epilithonimonas pallida]|uniref:TIGR04255 family protein n=1 Tax=Epilithonimonas pallida TaxID=373671 RepID=A0ABY1R571_9FLAO|nr:hypothetical protein [Epilithonimonas pallida]SMP94699.1 hypothetical protein SAMN05421679_10698 [Epilithonimonas pallida]
MITVEVPEAKHYFYVPESMAECDGDQYLRICKLLYWLNFGVISYERFKDMAVYALLGLKFKKENIKTEGFIPSEDLPKWENVFRISELLDSFFDCKVDEQGNKDYTVRQDFIHNHNPVYRLFRKYYGPEEGFTNVKFGQYLDGLEELIDFRDTGEIQSLRNLFAIFYLPKGEIYNKRKSLQRAKRMFRFVDIRHLYGMFVFFSSFQNYMMSGEITVMGQTIDLEIIFKDVEPEKSKSSIPGLGWITTAQDLAESGVFGAFESVRNTELWPVVLRLYDLKKRAFDDKKREEENSKNQNI